MTGHRIERAMDIGNIVFLLLCVAHLAGFPLAYRAIIKTRTPQGTMAWALGLILIPWLAIPFYLLFGQRKFQGYLDFRKREIFREKKRFKGHTRVYQRDFGVLSKLFSLFPTEGNHCSILKDTVYFAELERLINEEAKSYILFQVYIYRADETGDFLRELLIKRAKEGVRVYLLYDEVGCSKLPRDYFRGLPENFLAFGFNPSAKKTNRYQINFRNHRKIVVIDGRFGICGGHNIGNEYRHRHAHLSPWRDTSILLDGASALQLQMIFWEDFSWALPGQKVCQQNEIYASLNWKETSAGVTLSGKDLVFIAPPGPSDQFESASLMFCELIEMAKKRIYLATPYFVPDSAFMSALGRAALSGVEVKVLLPGIHDHKIVKYASYSYIEEGEHFGIKFYRYDCGFLHQKVLLIDDDLAVVGSANLDNRSLKLNFEILAIVESRSFNEKVEAMFREDFEASSPLPLECMTRGEKTFLIKAKLARLTAPVL